MKVGDRFVITSVEAPNYLHLNGNVIEILAFAEYDSKDHYYGDIKFKHIGTGKEYFTTKEELERVCVKEELA